MRNQSRRAILTGAVGVAAAGALSGAALATPSLAFEPSALLVEHRRLLARQGDGSGMPDDVADALLDEISALEQRIWAVPVRSWADVVARAEVAAYWTNGGEGFARDYETGDWVFPEFPPDHPTYDDRSAAELISAVLTMARGGANV